ncbi:MAG: TonB-dependent receptor [bacterium]|nr:TonB-dependent receptor [bacterium]
MKKFLFFVLLILVGSANAQVTFSGIVRSKADKEPLPGAIVYFPDLRNGAVSQKDGSFEINNLPAIKTLVQIKLIGYKSVIQVIDLNQQTSLTAELEESVVEQNEIVVTGVSKATEVKKSPLPMTFIDSKYLEHTTGTNAIDVLVNVPGLNAVSTGPGVSKPVVRGLSGSRILTLFDGVRQEGQQWGDEHGVEVDQYLIDRIEVVKGPASLIYGSDALGGVINLLPANPMPAGVIKGSLQANYQTNNKLRSVSAALHGNEEGLIWGIRASDKNAIDYKNRYDGRVFNTGLQEQDLCLQVGANRKWGYSHLTFSSFDNSIEIPDGSRDSASRKFTKQISEADTLRPVVSEDELNSYAINVIHQRVQHVRLASTSNFILGQSKMALRLGYQSSTRREYAHPQSPEVPGLYLKMKTGTYDLKYYLPEKEGWEKAAGINGMYQVNNTDAATNFVIPNYSLFDIAPFLFAKKNKGKWDLAFGARYDMRTFKNSSLFVISDPTTGFDKMVNDSTGATKRFSEYSHNFSGFSGSFGLTYNFTSQFLIKANVARGFRAPNCSELTAKGVHPGTGFEQIGDANFKPEYSLQADVGAFFDSEHISASAEIFMNTIDNYIFNQKLTSLLGGDSIYQESGNNYPVYKFVQTKALLFGGEASLDLHPHPLDWLHIENSISLVYAENLGGNGAIITAQNKYLPSIPPLHTNTELRAEFRKKRGVFSSLFMKIGFQYYAAQNRAFTMDNTETTTPAYTLLDAGIGSDIVNKKGMTMFTLGFFGTNLMDAAYQSNMSRLKYFDNYPINGTGRSGIYSMGRNVSFKLTIPISIKEG